MPCPPFAIDSYLPAVSTIANELHVNIAMLSVTASLYIFGLAIGQLIGGPLSDKHGCLPIIMLGVSLFAGSSFLLASSTTITAI